MDTTAVIAMINAEIAKLEKVRTLLAEAGAGAKRGRGRPRKTEALAPSEKLRKRPPLSAAARAKIAEAQRVRWAKQRKRK
jgi:AT hook motif